MKTILSFLIFAILYSVQLYAARRKIWIIAFSLPIIVLGVRIINHYILHFYDLAFIESNYAPFFLGGAVASVVIAMIKNKSEGKNI
jgi:hypothetical protein